jgi:hypothetical protein
MELSVECWSFTASEGLAEPDTAETCRAAEPPFAEDAALSREVVPALDAVSAISGTKTFAVSRPRLVWNSVFTDTASLTIESMV